VVGALVVTHGNLARELVSAAKKIVGEAGQLQAVAIDWDDDVNTARETIHQALKGVDEGGGVLIFTDMFGGTPTNISLTFLEPGRVEVVTGINLPMLIKFLNLRGEADLRVVVDRILEKGQRSIQAASELLGQGVRPEAGD
jgi:PTS system mannose-specific IIA component